MDILGTTFFFIIALEVCLGFYLQTSEVQALVGESVILPCNGSGFPVEELQVHWEALGKDVISLRGDVVTVGRGFEDRVNFLKDPTESEDFSLILSDVMLNDGEIYECLWQGTKPICSVLLQVSTPAFFTDHIEAFEGDDITLECFGNIPKNKPWEDIYIQWLKDDREILRLSSGKMDVSIDYSTLRLPAKHDISRGIFSLSIASVSVFDQGVYQCRYKSTDYEAPRSGFPETYSLTVWVTYTSVTETGTDSAESSEVSSSTYTSSRVAVWAQTERVSSVPAHTFAGSTQTQSSSSSLPTLTYAERAGALFLMTTDMSVTETGTDSVTTDTSVTETGIDSLTTDISVPEPGINSVTTDASAPETGINSALFLVMKDTSVLETDTDSVTDSSRDLSVPETGTVSVTDSSRDLSVPETGTVSGLRDPPEFLSDEIPWIRIGLISGVLLITAVVLGLLLAFGRI